MGDLGWATKVSGWFEDGGRGMWAGISGDGGQIDSAVNAE